MASAAVHRSATICYGVPAHHADHDDQHALYSIRCVEPEPAIKNPLLKKTQRFDKHEQNDGKACLCRSSCRRKCGPAAGGMGRHATRGGPAAGASSAARRGEPSESHGAAQAGPRRVDGVRALGEDSSSSEWLEAKQAEKVEWHPELQQAMVQYIDCVETVPSRRACDQDGDAAKVCISTSLLLMSRVPPFRSHCSLATCTDHCRCCHGATEP